MTLTKYRFFNYFCSMRLSSALLLAFILLSINTYAQPVAGSTNVWTLQRCVQYAVEHNISIKQDSLSARLARYTLKQSELSQLPSLNVNGSLSRSFGRSINPATNQFVDASYNSLVPTASGNLLLFGWLQVRNTIEKNRLLLEASLADLDQLKDDISVNVANGFLAAVLAEEQINVSRNQVALSKAQLDQTRAFADAGRLPELNVAQLESQLATDSSNLINSIANYNSSVLDLKTLLNLDFATPFTLQVPDVKIEDQFAVYNTEPAEIFQKARMHFGSIKGSELRVKSAQKLVASSKGSLYPQLSLGYQVGTNWASNYESVTYVNGVPVYSVIPFNTQFNNNFREGISLNLNVPIFNSWQGQYAVRQSQINLAQSQLNEYNAELTLKQNVYKAHNNALNSIQKYYAAKRADEAAKRALDFARKRYDLGLTSTVDLLVTQNSEFAAAANLVGAKYDLIFKLKLVDYYLGKELKL
ncbi:MAG: TolC family protein [Flavipsychrobacter sp.]|nr:TolC family protein [Flavipsychrobacter sp.]